MEIKINSNVSTVDNTLALHGTGQAQKAVLTSNENTVAEILSLPEYRLEAIEDTEIVYGETVSQEINEIQNISTTDDTRSNQSLQSKLLDMKFYIGPIDGDITSDLSKDAIKKFQRVYGLGQTGVINSTTSDKINSVYEFYANTCTDSDIQSLANTLGLDTIQRNNMALTWTFLRQGMGLNAIQAAGVMGNIRQESGFVPNNANDHYYSGTYDTDYTYQTRDHIAYGLAQWCDESRKIGLKELALEIYGYTAANNITDAMVTNCVKDINVQFAFIRKEATSSCSVAWNNLKQATTIESATRIFKEQYEICDDDTLGTRINYAYAIYNALA